MVKPNGSLAYPYLGGALRDIGVEAYVYDATVGDKNDNTDDFFGKPTKLPSGKLRTGVTDERILEVASNYDIIGITSIFSQQEAMALTLCKNNKKKINVLISAHPDGQLLSNTVKHFKIDTIIGSSSKGSSMALRNIIRSLKSGISIGITPDGPRGPKMKINSGIIKIASLTGCKIVPLSYSVKNKLFLNSWDKFLVALPFGKGCFIWGKPIKVKKNISIKDDLKLTKKLEKKLINLTNIADQYYDR